MTDSSRQPLKMSGEMKNCAAAEQADQQAEP